VLSLLADMIDNGRLSVKARGRGRRQSPGTFARDVVAFRLYDIAKKSEEEIAAMLGMSVESVHQAIIAMRKAHRAVK
jgi:hypothetical protein